MKILEVIQKSTDFLAKKGVESPRLQVELMLAHLLNMPRMRLYLSFEQALTQTQVETLRGFVQRRGNREPLQHILGITSFCGLDMIVNKNVLVPRPETELLAERAWKFLFGKAAAREEAGAAAAALSALDFGVGSGCIAVALAVHAPAARVCGVDVSAEALAVARENAARHKAQIEFLQGNGFAALPQGARFDLIVSNPPYISRAEIETLEPEVRDHEPRGALDGGEDGLDFYRMFAREAAGFLAPGGRLMAEFGDGQAREIQGIFERQNWVVEAVEADNTQRPRLLIARHGSSDAA